MPNVGELFVELDAKSTEFNEAMGGAGRLLDGFEQDALAATAGAGAAFKGLVGPIVAVGAALAALGTIKVGAAIASGAIDAAAAFETYEIRLRGLLGSQESANKAIESFVELSSKTPFAVADIVEGAATLASVADGSRKELDELTKTAANIAAQFGIPFAEAAGNMQRALASGIAAADKFRDLGVKKIIQDVQKIPDLTKLPLEEQRQAFKDTFGPDALTPFATAAEDLSKTMGGSLSNIADAAGNAERALGKALSPTTFGVAKGVIIPFFEAMERWVKNNQDAIEKFAKDGIRKLLLAFAEMLDSGALILQFLDNMGIQLSDIPRILSATATAFSLFFKGVAIGFQTLATGALILVEIEARRQRALRQITQEQLDDVVEFRKLSVGFLKETTTNFSADLGAGISAIHLDLVQATVGGEDYIDMTKRAAESTRKAAATVGDLTDEFVKNRTEREKARDEEGEGERVPGADLAAIAAAEKARAEAQKRADRDAKQAAREIEKERQDAQKRADKDAKEAVKRQKELAEELAGDLAGAIGEGFTAILNNEGKSFAEGLADLSGELLEESISRALESAEAQLAKLFEGLDLGAFGEGEGGKKIGQAFGVGLGIAGSFLASELGGTKSKARGGLIDSVVTSTQELRGIVAGDVNVPIAEVAGALRDINVEMTGEQRTTNSILREIRDRIGEGGGGIDGSAALVTAVGDELNGTPALG